MNYGRAVGRTDALHNGGDPQTIDKVVVVFLSFCFLFFRALNGECIVSTIQRNDRFMSMVRGKLKQSENAEQE